MSQFSGRQTDSHGLARHRDASTGDMVPDQPHRVLGARKSGHNKGVMALRREEKRGQAEERNALTLPERRSGSAFKHRRLTAA